MKTAIFVIALLCTVAGTYSKDPEAVKWRLYNDNGTCFMADMAIQWHVSYMTNGDKVAKEMVFLFNDSSALTAPTCNSTDVELTFTSDAANQSLTLAFTSDDASYWMSSAMLSYFVSNEIFGNATDVNQTITAMAMESMKIPLNTSYSCSIETQFRMESNASDVDIYVRLIPPAKKILMWQAVAFEKNDTYGNESKCFYDQPMAKAPVNTYKVATEKGEVCALLETSLMMEVDYMPIKGNKMSAMIPVPADAAKSVSGTCEKNRTTMMIQMKGVGNITLGFTSKSVKYGYFSTEETMVSMLDTFTFVYDTKSMYFPNNGAMNDTLTDSKVGLKLFETPSGLSYTCDGATSLNVTNGTIATFNQTRLQAFDVKNGTFANESSNCQAPASTTMAPTTTPLRPDPVNPEIGNTTIIDPHNNTCLHAMLGLQLKISYKSKITKNMTEAIFNYDVTNNATTSLCNDSANAMITFSRTEFGQMITLYFKKDNSTKTTYLNMIDLTYDASKLPNSSESGNISHTYAAKHFEVPSSKSYQCSSERDILINNTDMSIVRMLGLKLEAFPAKKEFAAEEKCFSERQVPAPTTGTYYINSTAKNSSICAAFKLAVAANVTYYELIDLNPKTVYISVNGTQNSPSDGSFGMCGDPKNPNKTTLVIPLDDGRMKFSFVFKKENMSGDNFDFSMESATLEYSTSTKYFPNHEYAEGGMVTLSGDDLMLFASNQDHSYKCNKNTTATLKAANPSKEKGTVSFSNVQVQPFGIKSDGGFKSVDECSADDLSPLIPIIVGSVLAGLIVIVLVAYVIGRRRNSGTSYESI